jgi:hypothetical protein
VLLGDFHCCELSSACLNQDEFFYSHQPSRSFQTTSVLPKMEFVHESCGIDKIIVQIFLAGLSDGHVSAS